MRVEFCHALETELRNDPKSLLITGDLGFQAFESIARQFAGRFVNAGIAEQNMMGLAAGIAMEGYHPWVYSIAPFGVFRCFEQIRNDVCFHKLPVRIVGNGGGFTYGMMGSSHHALEDLGALKALGGMSSFFPAHPDQVKDIVHFLAKFDGPAYLRLGVCPYKSDRKPLDENHSTFTRCYNACAQPHLTVIGVGHVSQLILQSLDENLIPRNNVDIFTLSRFPFEPSLALPLIESVKRSARVIVVEEHFATGGIGESLRQSLPNVEFYQVLAPENAPPSGCGSARYHYERIGLTPQALGARVQALCNRKLPHDEAA